MTEITLNNAQRNAIKIARAVTEVRGQEHWDIPIYLYRKHTHDLHMLTELGLIMPIIGTRLVLTDLGKSCELKG